MIVSEVEMLELLGRAKKVTLLEPPYKRKYPPLGLSKIASYIDNHTRVTFQRDYEPWGEDLVCITSLFTYDSRKVLDAIAQVSFLNPTATVLVGGVFASLMPKMIENQYPNVNVFVGYSKVLDQCIPANLEWRVDDPWDKFSFVFTTRGCPNRCKYCAVWHLEPDMWINPTWREHLSNDKPYAMISDNNLSAHPTEHLKAICDFLIEHKKSVVFDNGFDCKHITPEIASLLAKLKYARSGLRLAFDRIEEDGIFQEAVGTLTKAGVSKGNLMAYVLFNFEDTPQEAIYRMEECIKLGVRPYPQQFTPLNSLNRANPFIGKHWTKNLSKVFRFFFLMSGYYTKHQFIDWVQSAKARSSGYTLNDEDWAKLRGETPTIIHRCFPGGTREYKDYSPAIQTPAGGGHIPEVAQALQTDGQLREGVSWGTTKPQSARNIRRLTPLECERLQGFPDGWTEEGIVGEKRFDEKTGRWNKEKNAGETVGISDTQRYKVLGNAVTVNVIEAIGRQLLAKE